jgi:hypothetical protein
MLALCAPSSPLTASECVGTEADGAVKKADVDDFGAGAGDQDGPE